jgi:hypothetical protein
MLYPVYYILAISDDIGNLNSKDIRKIEADALSVKSKLN